MNDYVEADKTSLKLLLQIKKGLSTRLENLTLDLSKSHSRDSTEQAVERENDEVIDSLESETQEELLQVKNAIERIEKGKYRICSGCGNEIPAERLTAIPYTAFCLKCAASQQ
ncbi:MAG: TraR/DksA family transcriptional regulator [Cocleimonas sp.]